LSAVASPGRFPALDGLRGCAALAVLLFHGWALSLWTVSSADGVLVHGFNQILSLGWAGVDVFFTLSAFLLSLPFVQAARDGRVPDLRRYLLRRVLRIVPAYWLQFVIIALVFSATLPSLGTLIAHLGLWLNIGSAPVRPLLPVWWTLPVEFGFYLLLPGLALMLRPGRWPWLLLLVIAAPLYRQYVLQLELAPGVAAVWADHLPGRIDQFAIGMLGAYAWVHAALGFRLHQPRHTDAVAIAGLLLFVAVLAFPLTLGLRAGPWPTAHPLLLAWHGYASLGLLPLLWAGAAGKGKVLAMLATAPLRWLGRISFSLYLWHYPLMMLARPHAGLLPDGPWRPLWFNLVLLPACLLVAWLSWRLVEAPAMRWSRGDGATSVTRAA
jgi:peptidoglycan/LPS O-acetylase OafA/YrhL